MLEVSVAEANGLRSASVASAEADHERRLYSLYASDRGIDERRVSVV